MQPKRPGRNVEGEKKNIDNQAKKIIKTQRKVSAQN